MKVGRVRRHGERHPDAGHDRELDDQRVSIINSDLTTGVDLTQARRLRENAGIAFLGSQKAGPFDVDEPTAQALLASPNPDGRSNAEVFRRRANGHDVVSAARTFMPGIKPVSGEPDLSVP